MRLYIVRLLALLMLLASAGCALIEKHIKKPSIEFKDASVREVTLAGGTIDFNYRLHNPNRLGLPVKSFRYELTLNGKTVVSGQTAHGVEIPARGATDLSLPLSINFADFIDSIEQVFDAKGVQYQLTGVIDFGIVSIPFRKTGHFDLPQIPAIEFSGIRLKSISLDKVRFSLNLDIINPNAFSISLDKIDYNLKLDGGSLIRGQNTQNVNVGGNNRQSLVLDISLDINQIKNVYDRFRRGGTMPIQFSGNIELDGFTGKQNILPVNWSGNVNISR